MKRQTTFAMVTLLLNAGPSVALEDQWGYGKITDNWYYADYTTAQRTVTLYCVDKENQFIYGMPAKDLDPVYSKLEYVDLVLDVDNDGADKTYDRIETAVAKVEVTADMISFKVVGELAWALQSTFGFADVVTIGVSQRYLPDNPDIDGKMVYLNGTVVSQEAALYVMGPCVPEGYNDNPPSSEEPPGEDDTEGVSPKG